MIHNAAVLITKLDVQYVLLGVNILFKKGISKFNLKTLNFFLN